MPKINDSKTEVKEFERNCIFCEKEIIMRNIGFGWHPYEKNNKIHKCDKNPKHKARKWFYEKEIKYIL